MPDSRSTTWTSAAAVRLAAARLLSAPARRWLEAGALALGLLTVGLLLFGAVRFGPGALPALLAAPLPLLLWAAIRFGPGGTSLALLLMAFLATWTALQGHGPFASLSPEENLLSLQLFLVALAVPLLVLAAWVQERQHATLTLRSQEGEARRQLAQLIAIYRTAPVGLTFLDTDLRYIHVNDHQAELNGLPAADHLGRTLRQVLPDLADAMEPVYRQVIAQGTPVVDVQVRGSTASQPGVERIWLASHYPVRDEHGTELGVNTVVREITGRQRAEEALRSIAAGVSATTGETFFRSLVQHISEALQTEYVFVCELIGANRDRVRSIATYADAALMANVEYDLVDTPCATVVQERVGAFPQGVRARFPRDRLLQEMAVESYLGVRLWDSAGQPLGILAVMSRQPLLNPSTAESVLTIFAARASAELERRRAEEALRQAYDALAQVHASLRQSEERYRAVVESQTELVCRYLPDTTLTFVNEAYCRYFGRGREELIGRKFLDLIPDPARPMILSYIESLAREPRAETKEHEVVQRDGSIGWQQWVDYAVVAPDGQVLEFQGIGRDITDRKQAEEALRRNEAALRASYVQVQDLAGRLIAAQEDERTRIARELHDDISQQLAALAIALSSLNRRLPEGATDLRDEVVQLQRRTIDLADDLRHLSHELHPGVLQHAGLVAALQAHCSEFRSQHGIEVTLHVDDELGSPGPEVSLCLYRVVQEALQNIARHACARRARITLAHWADSLELTIADDGQGFDLAEARRAGGLGLISLDERVRLVRGRVRIDTRPQWGTELQVQIPLGVAEDAPHPSVACR